MNAMTVQLEPSAWMYLAIIKELANGETHWRERTPSPDVENFESIAQSHAMMARLYYELRIQMIQEYKAFAGNGSLLPGKGETSYGDLC